MEKDEFTFTVSIFFGVAGSLTGLLSQLSI